MYSRKNKERKARKITRYIVMVLLITCSSKSMSSQKMVGTPLYPPPVSKEINWNLFADDFQQTLTTHYTGESGTYNTRPSEQDFNYWYNAHVLDVLVDGYTRTSDETYLPRMKALLRGIEIVNPGYWKVFVDDMAWLGIASMNAWHATKDSEYKNVAQYILTEIRKAHTPVLGGGLQWRFDRPNGKNTCSTAPGAILALRLYQADKKEEDLQFAKELFQWLEKTLLNPANNLLWDNIYLNEQGQVSIDRRMFTYNVGTYIGTARELYLITKDEAYLDAAVRSAKASISSGDMVLERMFKEQGDHDGGLFKGILVRYLTELLHTDAVPDALKKQVSNFLLHNAETLYEKGSTPAPRVFASPNWGKRPEQARDISTQLSAMMLVEAVAKLVDTGLLNATK